MNQPSSSQPHQLEAQTKRYSTATDKRKWIYFGIDLHRIQWHVTIRTEDVEMFNGSIPGTWEALKRLLDWYPAYAKKAVYEAGYFGFWLYNHLMDYEVDCVVTPASLVPQEYGDHVKTNRRDSRKLSHLLAKGFLKRVWVPTVQQRYERQVIRTRRQLIRDRVRIQNRIKAELRFYGIDLPAPTGQWSKAYFENLQRLQMVNQWMQESFGRLLEEYQFLSQQVERQTKVLRALAETPEYAERIQILRSTPGIGLISAMEYLLELQDIERFRCSNRLAAYVGLTPSQYSSGEKYERIKTRAGSRRAIIAIARTTLLRTRRKLLDRQPYVIGLAA